MGGVWAAHAFQEWGGKGLGRVKTNHDKGVVFFKVPKSGVGRVWSNLTVKSTSLQFMCTLIGHGD